MISLVTDALAGFRLTRLLTKDELLAKPRHALGTWALERKSPTLYDFIHCPWCVGMWVAFGVVVARKIAPRAWEPLATALAISAVTGIISENT